MKKNILLLGLCLALSATTVSFAQCTQTGGCPLNPENNTCEKVYKPCPIDVKTCKKQTKCKKNCPQKYQSYVNKIQRERATVYNALNLTDEQIRQREELVKENTPIYEEKFEQLTKESKKLYVLKKANSSNSEISKQKKVVKKIKKDIETLLDKENKEYKKCLTRDQRSKYSIIKKLEKKEYKDASHQKDLYKANPQMRPFGNPTPCSSYKNEK